MAHNQHPELMRMTDGVMNWKVMDYCPTCGADEEEPCLSKGNRATGHQRKLLHPHRSRKMLPKFMWASLRNNGERTDEEADAFEEQCRRYWE